MTADTAAAVRSGSASAVPRSSATGHRRLDVQGLRAVAVLLVVLYHAGLPVPGGFVGVDVFFVISGYVITAMLQREWALHGRLAFGRFYLRRFLRLTPALALTVSVVAAASMLLQNPFGAQQTTARTGMGAMLLSANYVIGHASGDYFAEGALTNPLLHTWSLSVEEQFYLVFPALLVVGWLLVRRRAATPQAPVLIVTAIAVGSFALSVAWSFGAPLLSGLTDMFGGASSFAYYASVTRAWEFAAGALLVLVPAIGRIAGRQVAVVLGVTGAAALAASALLVNDTMAFPGMVALLPVVGTMLVIVAGSAGPNPVSSALSVRPMVWVGDRSYSWYLWHWPVIVFTALLFPQQPLLLVVAAAASLVPSVLSYRYVEQPLRRLRPRTRPRAAAVAVVTVGIPLALCAGLLVGANRGWGLVPPSTDAASVVAGQTGQEPATSDAASEVPAPATGSQDGDEVATGEGGSLRSQHAVVRAGCVNTDLDPENCRFGPTDATGTVLLAGDSQAYALADGVIDAAGRLGYDTVATSHTGCPFLARESSGVHNYPCASWQQDILDFARETRPAAVVIVNRAGGYVRTAKDWRTVARDDGRAATTDDEAAALYADGLSGVVTQLQDEGVPVVIVASVPEMVGYTNRTSLIGGGLGGAFTVDRATAEADRAPALDVETSLADGLPGVVVFDPNPSLCDDATCPAQRDGVPVYQDQYHLAVPGALLLSDGLTGALHTAIDEGAPQGGAGH